MEPVIKMREPLAYRMRPQTLDEIIGQQHLLSAHGVLRRCAEKKTLFSMIFYGPPGIGKTTLAMVLANEVGLPYRMFNAVNGTKKDLDALFAEARLYPGLVVIIDEVHRLNKDKQDLLLPHVENGSLTMIGATTANPLHSINPAIRSRCHLFALNALDEADILQALQHALEAERGFDGSLRVDEDAMRFIAAQSNGDVRYALNLLELASVLCEDGHVTRALLDHCQMVPNQRTSKEGDGHYDLLSAFQKSIRGSDVDAALYYLALFLDTNDLESLERRLLVIAYEDIGLGNPAAVARTIQAIDAAKRIGMPEARIPLAETTIYLASSPKSNSAYMAIDRAMELARETPTAPVPLYLRNAPTKLMKDLGYADGYRYAHDFPGHWTDLEFMPEGLAGTTLYEPADTGRPEQTLADRLASLWPKYYRKK